LLAPPFALSLAVSLRAPIAALPFQRFFLPGRFIRARRLQFCKRQFREQLRNSVECGPRALTAAITVSRMVALASSNNVAPVNRWIIVM
jgi:hypothetical protein